MSVPLVKPLIALYPSFGSIPAHYRVRPRSAPHDLRRAWTRSDPMCARHTGVGPSDPDLDPGGLPGRHRVGRRLRIRLDGPGRHGGGRRGGKRRPLAHAPAVPEADTAAVPADTDSHPHSPAVAETDAHPVAEADTQATAHTHAHAETSTETEAETEAEAARPAGARAGTRAPADPEARPGSPTTCGAETEAAPLAQAPSAAPREPGELPGVPPPGDHAHRARPHHAGRLRPAHHHSRDRRRRGPAPALTGRRSLSGGTCCRIGLFSSSRCWRPVPWWS